MIKKIRQSSDFFNLGIDKSGLIGYTILKKERYRKMTKKQIVDELEKYTELFPNRQAFERMLKPHLEKLLEDFQKKNQ